MSNSFPSVIEHKLKFLKLTRNGKVKLTPFSEKVLYHAYNKMLRTYDKTPEYPFNHFYAFALLEAKRIQFEPDWNMLTQFANYNDKAAATADGETLDMKKCHMVIDNLNSYTKNKNKYKKVYHSSKRTLGPTFNEGVTYWKHGRTYQYPDQALDEDSAPTQPISNYKKPLSQDDPYRYTTNTHDELKKAIRSNKMSKQGLTLLRNTFSKDPKLLQIIDAYLDTKKDAGLCPANQEIIPEKGGDEDLSSFVPHVLDMPQLKYKGPTDIIKHSQCYKREIDIEILKRPKYRISLRNLRRTNTTLQGCRDPGTTRVERLQTTTIPLCTNNKEPTRKILHKLLLRGRGYKPPTINTRTNTTRGNISYA